jgi:putative ATP-binding cassette transporter
VKSFTATTLSFTLIFLNGTFTVVAFAGVLWSISRLLFGIAVGYAVLGLLLTILLGRPPIGMNYRQFDREANFRSMLNHILSCPSGRACPCDSPRASAHAGPGDPGR